MEIVSIVGARPQFIKCAMVSRELRDVADFHEILVHTGQHYDHGMSQIFFDELGITPPDYNLGVGSGMHGEQTGKMLMALEQVLLKKSPGLVIVYGDTNSTMAGGLAAAKLHIPVAHVEAGLRSFNRRMPEEINRVVTDHLSDVLFAPTHSAVTNLRREGIPENRVEQVGDVMYDAALTFLQTAQSRSEILRRLGIEAREYALATVHRAENTEDSGRVELIFGALEELCKTIRVIVPLHPRTYSLLPRRFLSRKALTIIDPVGYLDMLMLEKNARLILTDSGGVQKEAFFYRVPCVTLRPETEWVELVELGWNHLASLESADAILASVQTALNAPGGNDRSPYGTGNSSKRIAEALKQRYLR